MIRKLHSFFVAIYSFLRHGDAPLYIATERELICGTCPEQRTATTGLFCNACGCPPSPISDLRTKWRMLDLKCPLDKW